MHESFGIGGVVVAPIGYGSNGDAGFECAVAVCQAVEGHESAVTPSPDGYAVGIDVVEVTQITCGSQLILGFNGAQIFVGACAKVAAACSCAASIDAGCHKPFLCQIVLPIEAPTIAGFLRVGAAVLQHDEWQRRGIGGVARFHYPTVQRDALVGGELEKFFGRQLHLFEAGGQLGIVLECAHGFAFAIYYGVDVGRGAVAESEDGVFEIFRKFGGLPAVASVVDDKVGVAQTCHIAFGGAAKCRLEIDGACFFVVAVEVGYFGGIGSGAPLFDGRACGGKVVQRAIAVFVAHDDETVVGAEMQTVQVGIVDVGVALFVVDAFSHARSCVECQQVECCLVAVQADGRQCFGIVVPAYLWQIDVGVVAGLHRFGGAILYIVHPQRHLRIGTACARIFVGGQGRVVVAEGLKRKFVHVAFVETYVGQQFAVGAPFETACEPKFLFVNPIGRAVDDAVFGAVGGDSYFGAEV